MKEISIVKISSTKARETLSRQASIFCEKDANE
jgi:hypothetical protein